MDIALSEHESYKPSITRQKAIFRRGCGAGVRDFVSSIGMKRNKLQSDLPDSALPKLPVTGYKNSMKLILTSFFDQWMFLVVNMVAGRKRDSIQKRFIGTFFCSLVLILLPTLLPSGAQAQSAQQQFPVLLSEVDFHNLSTHDGHPTILRCLTPLLIEVEQGKTSTQKMHPQLQEFMKAAPEIAQAQYMSPSGRFVLHYDITGTHAVPLDDTNESGVPDYVEFAAIYADSSYNYLVLELGFVDFLIEDRPYDIFFRNFPFYGLTRTITISENGNSISTTHIEVHHNFNGFPPNQDPDSQQLGSLKVTIAHEMKHAIQYATNQWRGNAGTINWVELDATMTEEIVFPTVKDYINYLSSSGSVFRGAHNGIPGSYEQATFGLYYVERFGPAFWVDVWDEIYRSPLLNMFTAMQRVLSARGYDFATEFANNMKWHMAAGTRSRPGFGFQDRVLYPNVTLSQSASALPYVSPMPTMRAYSARFYEVSAPEVPEGSAAMGILRASSNQSLAAVGFGSDASVQSTLLNSTDHPTFEAVHTDWDWETLDNLGLILVNTGGSTGSTTQFLAGMASENRSIMPYGDMNRDGRTNSADMDEIMMRVLQTPGPSIQPNNSLVDRKISDVSGNGTTTLYDAALIKRHIRSGSNTTFPADPDGRGWFPAASMMHSVSPKNAMPPNQTSSLLDISVSSEISTRIELSASPDNDSLWVYLDLQQRDTYSSIFTEILYDSSLVKLERVAIPSIEDEFQATLFFETATGARIGGLASDYSIKNTILELVFSPLQDTTVTIAFNAVHLDERTVIEGVPEVSARAQPKEGVSVPYLVEIPAAIELMSVYPNPFNPLATIPFRSDRPAFVEITVFDQLGRKIETLHASDVSAGLHQVRFDAGRLSSGVYLIRLDGQYLDGSGAVTLTQKITLIK